MVDRILLARFDIDMAGLGQSKVATMDFRPYQDILDEYLGQVKRVRNNKKFEYYEYPPIRQLNSVLTGSAPMLVHGFEEYGKSWTGKHSGIWFEERLMLAMEQDSLGNSIWKPSIDQLNDLIAVWAIEWFKEQFATEINTRSARGLLDRLSAAIRQVQPEWISGYAAQLWETKGGLKYDALRSILATIFVERMNGQEFLLNEVKPLRWRLTEGAKRLAVVSEPGLGGKKRSGLFSYKIEFVPQTQAGRKRPWIAVYLRIRRWADRAITKINFGHRVSVMVTLHSERKPGWEFTPTMIRLQVAKNGKGYYWAEHEQELLQAWQARELPDPNDLFAHPTNYQAENLQTDTYHILHTEGIAYKGAQTHSMRDGTSLKERADLLIHIGSVMESILAPDVLLQTDEVSTITPAQVIEYQLMPMYGFADLEISGAVLPKRSPKEKVRETCHQMMVKALFRASGDKPINIMLVAPEAPAQRIMEREVRRLLFLEEHEPLPDGIHLSYIAPDLNHQMPPASDLPLYPTKKDVEEKRYQHVLDDAWKKKVQDWENLITPYTEKGMCNLALIEMEEHDRDDWLKRAIRCACVKTGVLSQMVYHIDPKLDDTTYFAPSVPGERARITNAVKDLLLRQMNVLYGALPALYCFAGVSEEVAENLVVVGLYRHKTNKKTTKSQSVDFPVAVELYPDGQVLVVLPNEAGEPQAPVLYTEAATMIGQRLSNPGGKRKYETQEITTFVQAVLTQLSGNEVLMLFEADGWRSDILPLTNDALAKVMTDDREQPCYDLKLAGKPYTPETLNGVRMLRLRDQGTLGETPQYVAATVGSTWDDWTEFVDPTTMIGVVDTSADSPLFHFFSIGRQLQAVRDNNADKNELYSYGEGGDIAFKHQQAVEIVPFFLQAGDDPLVYCRIAHFLRSSPAWRGGNTVLPYPLHLAHTLFKDLLDVFSPRF